jgi:hypothetical protein
MTHTTTQGEQDTSQPSLPIGIGDHDRPDPESRSPSKCGSAGEERSSQTLPSSPASGFPETIVNELGCWKNGKLELIHPDRISEFQTRQVRTKIMDHFIEVAEFDELQAWKDAIREEMISRK